MGLDFGECWLRTWRFSWFGHQSWFVCGRLAVGSGAGMTGFSLSLPCSDTFAASPRVVRWLMVLGGSDGSGNAGAVPAHTPVGDLGLVDDEAEILGRDETGSLSDRALDVGDRP